jgi:hypothetical protein
VYGCSLCDDDARLHLDIKYFDTLSSSEDVSYFMAKPALSAVHENI